MRASIKERKLVQGVLQGKSVRQAAKEAGYAESTANVKSYGILKRPRVQSLLTDALERAGITPDRLAHVLADGLLATKVIKTQDGWREVPDHRIRLEAYEQATRAYGFVPKSQELPEPPLPDLKVNIMVAEPKAQPKPIQEIPPPAGSLPPLRLTVREPQR